MENIPLIKFIRGFIRDSSGVFFISSPMRISLTSFPLLYCLLCKNTRLYNKNKITRRLEDMNFIFSWLETIFCALAALVRKILFIPLENKIHIFAPSCNILYIYLSIPNRSLHMWALSSNTVLEGNKLTLNS